MNCERLWAFCYGGGIVQSWATAEIHRVAWRSRTQEGTQEAMCEETKARLKANPNRPTIPSILFANVHSLENKLDHLRLQLHTQRVMRDCCVSGFTATSQMRQSSWMDQHHSVLTGIQKEPVRPEEEDCVCISTIDGAIISRLWQPTAHNWWNFFILSCWGFQSCN